MNVEIMISKLKKLMMASRKVMIVTAISGMMFCLPTYVGASVVASEYYLHIGITTPNGAPIRRVQTLNDWQYSFDAVIHSVRGTLQATADIYFGAFTPGGKTLSWVIDDDSPKLVSGFKPLLISVELIDGQDTSISFFRGKDIKLRFTGEEPKGMYTVFAVLVKTGTDPADPDNWVGVTMTPLFVE